MAQCYKNKYAEDPEEMNPEFSVPVAQGASL